VTAPQISGGPIPDAEHFDLAAVEHALARLWHADDSETRRHDAVRACSLNLAIPIAPGSYDNWQESISELSGLIPSRILVIERREDSAKPSVDAEVYAACHRRKGGLLVCSEVVRLGARADSTHLIPSICRALAVSDLPFCLLALEEADLGRPTDAALIALADIVVTDSCSSRQAAVALAAAGKVTDLAWPRLSPWRTVLGNFLSTCTEFDSGALTSVELEGDSAAIRLFAGWLAQLLGWRAKVTPEGPVISLREADRSPVIKLLAGKGRLCGLNRVTLRLAGKDFVQIEPTAQTRFDVTAHFGDDMVRASAAVRTLSFAEEVAGIVHSHGMDRLYDQAAAWAGRYLPPRSATS